MTTITKHYTSDGKLREFSFSGRDFERVRELIYRHAGISLTPSKREMVYSRLSRRLRALGMKSFTEYLDYLEQADEKEWQSFINCLTTNLTSFFREAHHFDILREFLISRKQQGAIKIWCAAASTGEEPYSIAMTAVEALGHNAPVSILASDVDTQVLEHGERAVYAAERLQNVDPQRCKQFFLRGKDDNADNVMVKPELRDMITFRRLNLLDPGWPLSSQFDAIFCRNVMIYFDKPTQYAILKKFAPLLKADGLLFVGHSESLFHAGDLFRLRSQTVYEHARARSPLTT